MTRQAFRIAAITTVVRHNSHAQVILSRWHTRRPDDAAWGWHGPRTQLASLYVDQTPGNDMSIDICRQHRIALCPTVEQALTLGTGTLSVDAVFLIAEHGHYPWNEFGQHLYPRKELFDQITDVFRRYGKSVPVFCDKHLSWNFQWAQDMVQTARELGFDLTGGSSMPLCRTQPPFVPMDAFPTDDVVCVFHGGNESYGYHSVEFVQSLIESRPGAETGVAAITAWKGESFYQAQAQGRWSESLVDHAVDLLRRERGPAPALSVNDKGRRDAPAAFQLEFRDGLRVTHLNLSGRIAHWAAAMRHRRTGQIQVTMPVADGNSGHPHFAALARVAEDHWLGTQPTFPVERLLLTTGIIAYAMRGLAEPGTRIETPDLHIPYQPTAFVHPADRPCRP